MLRLKLIHVSKKGHWSWSIETEHALMAHPGGSADRTLVPIKFTGYLSLECTEMQSNGRSLHFLEPGGRPQCYEWVWGINDNTLKAKLTCKDPYELTGSWYMDAKWYFSVVFDDYVVELHYIEMFRPANLHMSTYILIKEKEMVVCPLS